MTLWIDALLAYLHFTAIFLLFAFLTAEVMMMRGALDAPAIRLLGRVDLGYFAAAIGALNSPRSPSCAGGARSNMMPRGRWPTQSAGACGASS